MLDRLPVSVKAAIQPDDVLSLYGARFIFCLARRYTVNSDHVMHFISTSDAPVFTHLHALNVHVTHFISTSDAPEHRPVDEGGAEAHVQRHSGREDGHRGSRVAGAAR